MSSDSADEAYDRLLDRAGRIYNVGSARSVLNWDQQVMMPDEGTPARSEQLSTLSAIKHELLIDDETGELLDTLEGADLDPERAAVVRELRREHDRAVAVPTDLVERLSEASSDALPVWEDARENDDFGSFAPALEELVELNREYAEQVAPDRDPYGVLFEEYEPYLGLDAAELVLERLRDELVPLIESISESGVELARPFDGTYDADAQEAVVRAALDALGYDWDRGRLDTSTHPFSTGNMYDTRITTRFNEADPLESLLSTVHEFGHATYNLGLPEDYYGTPLGNHRGLTVHESQSRFWENHVGRTRAFWELFLPTMREGFPGFDASPGDVYEAANQVHPDNLIRVDADELTYHLHIVLRFEIERDLIAGDIGADEIPAVWNDKMDEYLGVRPDTDTEGCLQDIHWSHGSFGYFPTYSLGSVLAAQLHHHAAADVDGFDGRIRAGEVGPVHDWLTEHVHRHGRRYTTQDLIEEATGEGLTADYFLDYARGKFGELYGL